MGNQNRKHKNERTSKRQPPMRKTPLRITVAVRSMTAEEDRQFDSALQLLLAETIRQHLGRTGNTHEIPIT